MNNWALVLGGHLFFDDILLNYLIGGMICHGFN